LTSSGVPASASFVSVTSPATGANRSLTALTDSTTPKVASWSGCGRLGQLDEDDVAQLVRGVVVIPTTASSPSTRTHSWSLREAEIRGDHRRPYLFAERASRRFSGPGR
jgi:hypothetical protein